VWSLSRRSFRGPAYSLRFGDGLKGLVERDALGRLALTGRGRAVLQAMLPSQLRWNGYQKIDATIVSGGGFFPPRG